MSARRRLATVLSRSLDPRVTAGLASVYLTARSRTRCRVRHENGRWIHRYADGTVVDTVLGGRSAAMQDRATEDVFLFGYRPRPGDVVLDVGAGTGSEVRLLSRLVGPRGRVVAIEAHPRTFACLRRTIELNGLTNVTPLECAVVGEPGPVHLEDDAEAHIRNGLTSDTTSGVEVPGRTLDEIVSSLALDRIDLLKMNIEGAELPALDNATGTLKQVRNLVVSCHDFLAFEAGRQWQRTFTGVVDLLQREGYVIRTRRTDPRPWVRYYVYASRPHHLLD